MSKKMPSILSEDNISLPSEVDGANENLASSSETDEFLIPAEGIAVIATRKGFYGQLRKKEGDKFLVKKFESLGEWMICEDKDLERKRKKFFKNKKANK